MKMKKKKTFYKKVFIWFLLINLLNSTFFPTAAWALTTGPSQPEVQSFEPVGTSEMVDLFSGDFTYNIPLLDVDGYPVNLSYHASPSMDEEASWVGLGWNINAGVINRNMRGLPDDFKGDLITKTTKMKDNITVGVGVGIGTAIAGNENLGIQAGIGINYNNYVGMGMERSLSLTYNSGKGGKGPLSGALGFKSNNTDGLSISPSVSMSAKINREGVNDVSTSGKVGIGTSFNSRVGLKTLSLTATLTDKWKDKNRKNQSGSVGHTAAFSFGAATFTPQVTSSMRNFTIMFSASLGGTAFLGDVTGNANGYFSKQSIANQTESFPAYGYMYEEEGAKYDKVMLDFNREKDNEFSVNTPALPVTNHTYDVFSVAGQGLGGSYRLHRGEVANVFDARATTTSGSYSFGAEITVGNLTQVGADITVTNVNTTSGKWTSENDILPYLNYKEKTVNNNFEPAYFKQAGEKTAYLYNTALNPTVNANNLFNNFGSSNPIRPKLNQSEIDPFLVNTEPTYSSGSAIGSKFTSSNLNGSSTNISPSTNVRNRRDKRNQEIAYLKASESNFMLNPNYLSQYAKPDHIAEVSVLQPGGQRYIFGKALYNVSQDEVTFNTAGRDHCMTGSMAGYVNYQAGADNGLSNSRGADNYYSKTNTPAYAHSYLLTAVLAPDYVDVDGVQGPSIGDFGNYTAFEYQHHVADGQNPANLYKWRAPFAGGMANYNEGFKTKELDDKGSYVYGTKEVAYLQYIKTKNYVAVFELNDDIRQDGFGVAGEDGGIGNSAAARSRYLKTITLYSRVDFEQNQNNAFPIKKVHLEYDNTLCAGIENGNGANVGKLTLKKVYFTYGKSNKGKFSSYKFTYGDFDHNGTTDAIYGNPNYAMKDVDRWGNYKKSNGNSDCNPTGPITNTEFPYVDQDIEHDKEVAAWSLTQIELPSGGEIRVDYEADDYAYVQDKNAMQMFKIAGIGDDENDFNSGSIVDLKGILENGGNKGYFVDMIGFNKYQTIDASLNSLEQVKLNYFRDLVNAGTKIYFRAYMKVNGSSSNNGFEYVSGYAEVDPESIKIAPTNRIFFKLKSVTNTDDSNEGVGPLVIQNPISNAAIKFARMQTPREAFSIAGEPSPSASPENIIGAMLDGGFLNTAIQTLTGPDRYLFSVRQLGQKMIPSKSWFRLYTPYKNKMGGGSRVKRITISDKWKDMNNGVPFEPNNSLIKTSYYGQEYDYTTTEMFGSLKLKVSSGVASYEPMIAGDENPFRKPIASGTSQQTPLSPDTRYYLEEPFGESLFPSANVGYSKVSVRTLNYGTDGNDSPVVENGVTRHSTGYVVNEFYTAKDYPISVRRTDLSIKEAKSGLGAQLLQLDVKHYMTATQGFVVEMNDMHGKQKAMWVYAEGQTSPQSGVQYFYKDNSSIVNGVRNNGNRLQNEDIPIIGRDGVYYNQNTNVGIDFDFVSDFREEETVTETAGAQLNLYVFYVVLPFAVPPIWPSYSKESVRLRTGTFTKVVNKYAIMDEVVAYDNGAKVATKNLVWDGETGEVLLTQTTNEFKDNIYSFTYPAHWAYPGMASAYVNTLVEGNNVNLTSSSNSLFFVGDEVIVTKQDGTRVRAWVVKYNNGGTVVSGLFDKNNTQVIPSNDPTINPIKVIRSGRRNMQSTPIGSITMMTNPIQGLSNGASFNFGLFNTLGNPDSKILNAASTEFTDIAKMDCNCMFVEGSMPSSINPYYYGVRGNWRPKTAYTLLSDRKQTNGGTVNNTGKVRTDGTFTNFTTFWKLPGTVQTFNTSVNQLLSPQVLIATPGNPNDAIASAANPIPKPYWTFTSALSIFSAQGQELETRDALSRFSSATYGYNNTMALSVASNTRYQENGYDGFEDHAFLACPYNQHFKFIDPSNMPVKDRAHTGKYSLKLTPGQNATLNSTYQLHCINQEVTTGTD